VFAQLSCAGACLSRLYHVIVAYRAVHVVLYSCSDLVSVRTCHLVKCLSQPSTCQASLRSPSGATSGFMCFTGPNPPTSRGPPLMRHQSKPVKLSHEVAPTSLRLVLLMCSFQFRSAFPPHCRIGFPSFSLTFSRKGNVSACDLDL